MDAALVLPFELLECPRVALRLPRVPAPGPMLLYAAVLATFYFVFSGIVYDLINEPPSIGQTQDHLGRRRAEVIMPHRINGQYVVEGLSAGFLFVLGGLGVVVLDRFAARPPSSWSSGGIAAGTGMLFTSFLVLLMFIKVKMPGY